MTLKNRIKFKINSVLMSLGTLLVLNPKSPLPFWLKLKFTFPLLSLLDEQERIVMGERRNVRPSNN